MNVRTIITFLFTISVLTACSNTNINNHAIYDDVNKDKVKQLVTEYSGDHSTNHSASITSTELIITENDGKEHIYPLPEEEFFISIAPFKKETHPCTNHSLTGCQGELDSELFNVYIEDTNGNVIVQDKLKTGANGFIDLWLPRNETFFITIARGENERAEAEITTYDDSPTCITTMQLL